TGTYPETLEDLIKTKEQYVLWIEKLLEAPYADQGIHYRYEYDREKDRYVLFSAGYDGKADSNISDGILGDDIGCIDGKDIGYMEKNGWWIYR
ncbi:hypothetical protein, partial [Anaerovibrio sp.]|uniref:hypothetical protein n=1 Tax=Anaerovibrio sp. TaxID=1872532 RepID=UPI003F16F4AD